MSKKRKNKLEQDLLSELKKKTLFEVMNKYAGRDVYIAEKPYNKLALFQIKKGTLNGIELQKWRNQKEMRLRISVENIGEGSSSSNNTEFNQYFWTFDEALAEIKALTSEASCE